LKQIAHTASKIFRVSDRRREQVPAVAFLINVLAEALPHGIKSAHFCQGGVREGILFHELLPSVRKQDPLEVATENFAPHSADSIYWLMLESIPASRKDDKRAFPEQISTYIIRALTNVLYVHSSMGKEQSSTSALYSTSTGLMSSTHGVSHTDRARLALILEERYQGELPPREQDFKASLRRLLTPEQIWWTRYLGKVAFVISSLYPAGTINEAKPRVVVSATWSSELGKKKDKEGVLLTFSIQKVKDDPMMLKVTLEGLVGAIEKVGKKKNWIGGKEGWGMKVKVKVVEEDLIY
jgi:retrograde regulation protein 2